MDWLGTMEWLLVATGFTGCLTLGFLCRRLYCWLRPPLAISVYFSPKGGCTEAIVQAISRARREILVQAFSFTSRPIAQALIDAKARGLDVAILLDRSQELETHSELKELLGEGLAPLIDAEHASAHNKVLIIDGKVVVTGSFNFTNQAEHENAENVVIIQGHLELARSYRQNFLEHKTHSEPASRKALGIVGGSERPASERKVA